MSRSGQKDNVFQLFISHMWEGVGSIFHKNCQEFNEISRSVQKTNVHNHHLYRCGLKHFTKKLFPPRNCMKCSELRIKFIFGNTTHMQQLVWIEVQFAKKKHS